MNQEQKISKINPQKISFSLELIEKY